MDRGGKVGVADAEVDDINTFFDQLVLFLFDLNEEIRRYQIETF